MNINEKFNEAKTDLKNVKDLESASKVHWLIPIIIAVLFLIFHGLLQTLSGYVWGVVVIAIGLAIWTIVENSKGKANPLKVGWMLLLFPALAVAALLIVPQLASWVILILFIWAAINFVIAKPWVEWNKNTD